MIVVDTETTGLDPKRHSIIEIGAIDFNNPKNYFNGECQLWIGAEVDLTALELNGFTLTEIQDKKILTQEELISNFKIWTDPIEDRTIAGQNVDFDISFLIESTRRIGQNFNWGERKIDQHSIAYAHYLKRTIKPPLKGGISNLDSDTIMNYAGLPPEPKPHRALNGARYETEALSKLISGKGVFDEFAEFEIPYYLIKPLLTAWSTFSKIRSSPFITCCISGFISVSGKTPGSNACNGEQPCSTPELIYLPDKSLFTSTTNKIKTISFIFFCPCKLIFSP